MGSSKSIAIVGGGIAGITTAYFLARKNYKVRLFDPNGIAHQCSYANGGQLSVCNAEVWNTYSTVSYTHLRAHETLMNLVCRLLLADYQYKNAFVADHELNVVACLTEVMSDVQFN